jgi:hypothetical protein
VHRSGIFTALIGFLILCPAILAPTADATESTAFYTGTPAPWHGRLAAESLLRLTDMPPGFVAEEGVCGEPRHPSENEGIYERREDIPPTPEETFVKKTGTVFCRAGYSRLYRAPGTGATPVRVISLALVTPSAAAAAEGLALGPELVEETIHVSGFSAGVAPAIGEAARQFDTVQASSKQRVGTPGVLLLWRQGATIGGVFAAAATPSLSASAAATYAQRQQDYLIEPRPYLPAEGEDMRTFLDNPDLTVPVYWLGPDFKPKGEPETTFEAAFPDGRFTPMPGRQLSVEYTDGPTLDTWTRPGWAKFAKTAVGRRQWSWHCTRSRSVKLPHGHAVLYAAYRKDQKTCPGRPPKHFSAHVFLPGVVIAIGEPFNRWSQGYGAGAYESWRGLEAIVRRLHRWRPGHDS